LLSELKDEVRAAGQQPLLAPGTHLLSELNDEVKAAAQKKGKLRKRKWKPFLRMHM